MAAFFPQLVTKQLVFISKSLLDQNLKGSNQLYLFFSLVTLEILQHCTSLVYSIHQKNCNSGVKT